jgi:hypothetical protein
MKTRNRIELEALSTALTQYIENTAEDELGHNDQEELQAIRSMLERVNLELVRVWC